eukprot:NODE_177_length_14091_cov_0.996141.p2 type:complete len:428 gc:universal NODE_177_length_14091_cov_0.996141:11392-10109(-)
MHYLVKINEYSRLGFFFCFPLPNSFLKQMDRADESNSIFLGYTKFKSYEYTHWIPKSFPAEDVEKSALGSTRIEDYQLFRGDESDKFHDANLVHRTHIHELTRICDQNLKPRLVTDCSVINPQFKFEVCNKDFLPHLKKYDDVVGTKAIWLAPFVRDNDAFGPVKLLCKWWGNEGIFKDIKTKRNVYKYYWLETIDYSKTDSASRILVTEKIFDTLRDLEFDPFKRGGPFYIQEEGTEKIFYNLKKSNPHSKSQSGSLRNHTVEFLKDTMIPFNNIFGIEFTTHYYFNDYDYRNCKLKPKGICIENIYKETIGSVVLSTLLKYPQIFKSQQVQFINKLPANFFDFLLQNEATQLNTNEDLNWSVIESCLKDCNVDGAKHANALGKKVVASKLLKIKNIKRILSPELDENSNSLLIDCSVPQKRKSDE